MGKERGWLHVGVAAVVLLSSSLTVQAGGFQRGQPDFDILYRPERFAARVSLTQVEPRRGFETINGVTGDYGRFTRNAQIPNHSLRFGGDRVACAAVYTQSFGGDADYSSLPGGALPPPLGNVLGSRTRRFSFDSSEYSGTCRVSTSFGTHRVSVLGGFYIEDFNLDFSSFGTQNLTSRVAAANPALGALIAPGSGSPLAGTQFAAPVVVDVLARGGHQTGWRIGVAYEIPEIALRTQLVYRASIKHAGIRGSAHIVGSSPSYAILANGTPVSLQQFGAQLPVPGVGDQLAAMLPQTGTVLPTLPASLNTITSPAGLDLHMQTGIAPGTLLFGTLRWTDWSTLGAVIVSIDGTPGSITPFYWRDGYTGTIGLGRELSPRVSAAVSLGYDRGVGTGADSGSTDSYSLAAGISLKHGAGELRFGTFAGYLTSGGQSIANGALFDATVGSDWVYGANMSLLVGF